MATNPTSKNASFCFLEGQNNTVLSDRRARLAISFGTLSIPAVGDTNLGGGAEGNNALFAPRNTALDYAWRLSTRSADVVSPGARPVGIGFFLFRDNQDGGGAGTSRVVFVNLDAATEPSTEFPADAAFQSQRTGTGSLAAGNLVQPGTYKVVPVIWNITDQDVEDETTPPTTAQVSG